MTTKMLVFLVILCLQTIANAKQAVVKNLDIPKYMGRWYQIAAFPTRFQPEDSENTRATYTLNRNGTFNIVNESWNKGKRSSIEGIGFKADPMTDVAKFKVKFTSVPIPGDYWVLYVDHNYQTAIVGHPTKLFLFILNRQPQLDEKIYDGLVVKAKEEGYDVEKLRTTCQTIAPPKFENRRM